MTFAAFCEGIARAFEANPAGRIRCEASADEIDSLRADIQGVATDAVSVGVPVSEEMFFLGVRIIERAEPGWEMVVE